MAEDQRQQMIDSSSTENPKQNEYIHISKKRESERWRESTYTETDRSKIAENQSQRENFEGRQG